MSELKRFRRMVTEAELPTAWENLGQFPEEPLETEVDLTGLEEAVESIMAGGQRRTEIDKALVEPMASSMGGLTRREASDMRVWHWLTVKKFPELVRRRWDIADPSDGKPMSISSIKRFLGKPTLQGSARNTFSRIWWTIESLDWDVERAKALVGDADAMQGTLDRFFSAFPSAPVAVVDRLIEEGVGEDDQRAARRWLQQALGTTVLEVLTEDEVKEILSQRLDLGT